jgi:hypothetical protein
MIKKFDIFNEGVKDLMTGKPQEELKSIVEQLLEEAYEKEYKYTSISLFEDYIYELFKDYFLMLDIHSPEDVYYLKYKDAIFTVMEVKGGEYMSVIYKDKTVDEFKDLLQGVLNKLN